MFANDHVVVKDHDPALLDDAKPELSNLVCESVLIDLFNEPVAERIGNPESKSDDPLGQRIQQPLIPLIHLNLAYPALKASLGACTDAQGGANCLQQLNQV